MSEIFFTAAHTWAREEDDGEVTIGLTDYAQEQLSDLTFVELLPDTGEYVKEDGEIATVESVRATNEVYSPIAGTVTAVNGDLADQPELVNSDPFGKGWLIRLRPDNPEDLRNLLDADAYEEILPSDDE